MAARYDGTRLEVLIDGVVVGSTPGTLSLDWNAPDCPSDGYFTDGCYYGTWIGSTATYSRTEVNAGYTFDGRIDEVRIGAAGW